MFVMGGVGDERRTAVAHVNGAEGVRMSAKACLGGAMQEKRRWGMGLDGRLDLQVRG